MKKFFTAMSIVFGLGLATAQQTAPSNHKQASKTTQSAKPSKVVKTKAEAAPTAAKMKKDGTPDKRYKENKKLKKDGTPDKRYKENK